LVLGSRSLVETTPPSSLLHGSLSFTKCVVVTLGDLSLLAVFVFNNRSEPEGDGLGRTTTFKRMDVRSDWGLEITLNGFRHDLHQPTTKSTISWNFTLVEIIAISSIFIFGEDELRARNEETTDVLFTSYWVDILLELSDACL
jgi:hypothetical protein